METQKTIEAYQPLFEYMYDEHNRIMLQEDMDEIIRLSQKVVKNYSSDLNWFQRMPLHFKLIYHLIGGVVIGIMISQLFIC